MPQQSTQVTFTFVVNSPLLTVTPNPTAPPAFTRGSPITPYPLFSTIVGGDAPYLFSIDPSTPFPGMSVDVNGVLSGTPQASTPSLTVKVNVRDSGV